MSNNCQNSSSSSPWLAVMGSFIAFLSLWHMLVIAPLIKSVDELKQEARQRGEVVKELQINNAKLGVTLNNLADAINKLTNRLEDSEVH